jgi:biopolymer transport protein ExbB/TolQ
MTLPTERTAQQQEITGQSIQVRRGTHLIDVNGMLEAISTVGLPIIIAVIVIYSVYNIGKRILTIWEQDRAEQRKRDVEDRELQQKRSEQDWADRRLRQQKADEQYERMIQIAEISTKVIERNTAALENNTEIHKLQVINDEKLIDKVTNMADQVESYVKGAEIFRKVVES